MSEQARKETMIETRVTYTVESNGKVRLSGTQASHMLSSLAAGNGLVDVPPRTTLMPGIVVRVLSWGD